MSKIVTPISFKQGFAQWIDSYDWEYFATFTTRNELTLKSARRAMEGYAKYLKRSGKFKLFWGAEPFEVKDGFHVHALVTSPPPLHYGHMIQLWQKVSGNNGLLKGKDWNRVDLQDYDPKRKAGGYCTKYITKGLSDWDIHIH